MSLHRAHRHLPRRHWATDPDSLRLMLPPNCRARLCRRFLPSCWTCKNSPLSQNSIFQRVQGAPLAPMGGTSEIFCFSPQERSSHVGGWSPHPPVPWWKPDYKQCPRGWRGILHLQRLQQQQLCQCQLGGEGAEEPAQQWVQRSLPASPGSALPLAAIAPFVCATAAPASAFGEHQEPLGSAASGALLSVEWKAGRWKHPLTRALGAQLTSWGQNAIVGWPSSWLHDL